LNGLGAFSFFNFGLFIRKLFLVVCDTYTRHKGTRHFFFNNRHIEKKVIQRGKSTKDESDSDEKKR
jgi:hypothetical protein